MTVRSESDEPEVKPFRKRSKVQIIACVLVASSLLAVPAGWFLWSRTINWDYAAPARSGWEKNRPAFENIVKGLPTTANGERAEVSVPPKLGYGIKYAYQAGPNVIFYDDQGCGFLDDAGIAYMPNGVDPSLEDGGFEAPVYRNLGGPWYSFCASW